jgi:hypothetical protein
MSNFAIMEILFFIALGVIIIFPLVWSSSNTRQKSDILSTVGLDLSQSAKKKSESKDSIKRANVQIECAKNWVNKSQYNNRIDYWIAVKDIIASSDMPHDDFYTHFQFGDDDDIKQLCFKIIDNKIRDLSK